MFAFVRYPTFLKDVFFLSLTCFGGPQAHLAHYQKVLVDKRKYLTEADLMELNSLCQILPGPSSTQTLTAIGYKIGGPNLAYLTLLVWMLPSVIVMTCAGILFSNIQAKNWSTEFTRYIQPMAVGFVSYAAYTISLKTIRSWLGFIILILAATSSYLIQTPYVFPLVLICAGLITALKYKEQPKKEKEPIKIQWANFLLWAGVLIAAAALGALTKSLPIRLFENFYRNGSLIFGGGQVLTPMLYTEFVEYKRYLSSDEFLSGYALVQTLPGPVFSFCAFIGSLSMREFGTGGEILGALISSIGIFLPGAFMIFFVIRFWDALKTFRAVRASLEGITAASSGLVITAAILMFQPLENNLLNISFTLATFCLLRFTRIPAPLIILAGLALGLIVSTLRA